MYIHVPSNFDHQTCFTAAAHTIGRAFGTRKPFHEQYGSDSARSYGLVGTSDGKVYCVRLQQSDIVYLPHRVEVLICKKPKATDGTERLPTPYVFRHSATV
jgi:hypothetical protein